MSFTCLHFIQCLLSTCYVVGDRGTGVCRPAAFMEHPFRQERQTDTGSSQKHMGSQTEGRPVGCGGGGTAQDWRTEQPLRGTKGRGQQSSWKAQGSSSLEEPPARTGAARQGLAVVLAAAPVVRFPGAALHESQGAAGPHEACEPPLPFTTLLHGVNPSKLCSLLFSTSVLQLEPTMTFDFCPESQGKALWRPRPEAMRSDLHFSSSGCGLDWRALEGP